MVKHVRTLTLDLILEVLRVPVWPDGDERCVGEEVDAMVASAGWWKADVGRIQIRFIDELLTKS
jgi:hypothetical protein